VGFYERQVLPRAIDVMLGNKGMAQVRRPALAGLHGTVVELGFGSGPNVPLYPSEVERVIAIDPSDVGRKLASKRLAASTIPVEFAGLDGEHLPLDDASADCVLSTWTLCTIPDASAALREARRVLVPGGKLFFLEHGLSDDPQVAARQHRWNRVQNKIAGGCHLDRPIDQLVEGSAFSIERLATFSISGPKVMSFMYCGVAVAASD
jgi:ubiquinone/menaquinone biosynthesis C-methylase UbiE